MRKPIEAFVEVRSDKLTEVVIQPEAIASFMQQSRRTVVSLQGGGTVWVVKPDYDTFKKLYYEAIQEPAPSEKVFMPLNHEDAPSI